MSDGFRFHHIGVAVRDLDAATTAFAPLGFAPVAELPDAEDPGLCVRVRFLRQQPGQPIIELVAGLDEACSPVRGILQKNGPMPYHTCYEVADLGASVTALQSLGYRRITGMIPAVAFAGRRIQFLHGGQVGLIELLEES